MQIWFQGKAEALRGAQFTRVNEYRSRVSNAALGTKMVYEMASNNLT